MSDKIQTTAKIRLSQLLLGQKAKITKLSSSENSEEKLTQRLMEMGLTVGAEISISHQAPFGGAIAVFCRGSLIALRNEDANVVEVETLL